MAGEGALAAKIGAKLAVQTIGTALLAPILGPLAPFVGSFIGDLIGSLFDSGPSSAEVRKELRAYQRKTAAQGNERLRLDARDRCLAIHNLPANLDLFTGKPNANPSRINYGVEAESFDANCYFTARAIPPYEPGRAKKLIQKKNAALKDKFAAAGLKTFVETNLTALGQTGQPRGGTPTGQKLVT